MPRYKILSDVAIADVCFETEGKDLNELFENAAFATEEIMVDTKTVKLKVKRTITLEKENIEDLLYDFLSELLFLKDTEGLVFSSITAKIEKNKTHKLTAVVKGEVLDQKRHTWRADVKAVTLHMFLIEKKRDKWFCRVVLDV